MNYYTIIDSASEDPIVFSEEDILAHYWGYWRNQMEEIKEKYPDKDIGELTKKNCIWDWVVINWAWESTPEEIEKYHRPDINALTKLSDS